MPQLPRSSTPALVGRKRCLPFVVALMTFLLLSGSAGGQEVRAPLPDSAWIVSTYRDGADRITAEAQKDSSAYDRLAYLCDTFGPRLSGSENLAKALQWVLKEMKSDGLNNVHGEEAMVPHWVRGHESLELLEPHHSHLAMLGLGGSVATPPDGITAEVVVVKDFDELKRRTADVRGKIVLFDEVFKNYGQAVRYRSRGAVEAARYGAVASFIRSVTPMSLYTPHTGVMYYNDSIPKVPHAAITAEDAAMMARMQARGQKIVVRLKMEAQTLPDVPSLNVMGEVTGRENPDEVIIVGGHSDSWDVGEGAHDDGGGCIEAWEAVHLLKKLGLKPRRTVRAVLFVNEENGTRGGLAYLAAHESELGKHILAIESDAGVYKPTGFGFSGGDSARKIVSAVGSLLDPIGAGQVRKGGGGTDIGPIMEKGVPGMSPSNEGTTYFWYHHSPADMLDKIDPRDLNLSVAALAVMIYVVADLPQPLPR